MAEAKKATSTTQFRPTPPCRDADRVGNLFLCLACRAFSLKRPHARGMRPVSERGTFTPEEKVGRSNGTAQVPYLIQSHYDIYC